MDTPQVIVFSKAPDKTLLISVYDFAIRVDTEVPLYAGKISINGLLGFLNGEATEAAVNLETDQAFGPILRDL